MIDSVDVVSNKLHTLAATRSGQGDILSVAVTTSRLDDWRQTVPVFINNEFARSVKERGLTGEQRRRLQAGLDYVMDVLSYQLTPATQGVVVFSDGGSSVNEKIELPLRIANALTVEPRPYVRPLANAMSLLEPFVLAEVSRDDSSLYVVDEWGVRSENDLVGPWLRSSDRDTGEMSIRKYYAAARHDGLVEQHHKEVGASLVKLLEASGIHRVVLCAQHDIAAAFKRTLSSAVVDDLIAEIPWDAASSVGRMVAAARTAADRARNERMEASLKRILEGLGPGGHGVVGFDDVAGAVRLGQLGTLLVDRYRRMPGWRCESCSWVGLTAVSSCPVCGGAVSPTADALGELVRLTVLERGALEVGEDIIALDDLGGVAGLLRYA